MESVDNIMQSDAGYRELDDEDLVMDHVVQEDPELMYLHVCLSEILCNKGQEDLI